MNCMSYIELWHAHVASLRGLCLKLQSRVSSCLTENDIGLRLLQYNKAIKIHPHTNIKPVIKTNKSWKTLEKKSLIRQGLSVKLIDKATESSLCFQFSTSSQM